jgi:hypothetical protein
MPLLSAETFPLLLSAEPAPLAGRGNPVRHDASPPAAWLVQAGDASDVPDQSYWTAYDHYMVEREARAMRRVYVWTLLAKAWTALRPRR